MSFKRNFSTVLTAAAGSLLLAGAAFAQDSTAAPAAKDGQKMERHHGKGEFGGKRHGGFGRMGKRGGFGGGMFRDLNLTDAQKEQIKQIREANKANKADFDAIKPLMEARRNGTLTDDQKAQLKSFREAREAKMKSIHEQMLNVLTAEQKATLEAKKAERKQKFEQFREQRKQRREQRQQNGGAVAKPVV